MRVLFVHHTDVVGGAELSILELVSELVKLGVEPVALLPVGVLSRRFEKIGAKVINVPIPKLKRTLNPVKVASYVASRMKFSAMAKELIETESIDIVHFNSLTAAVLFSDGITNKAPAVLHLRDSIVPRIAFGTMAANLTAYIAISKYMKTVLTEFLGVSDHKVFEITNGLDMPETRCQELRNKARRDLGIPDDTVVFLCASAFVPWKNHRSLFDAFRRVRKTHPNAKLILCGKDVSGQNSVLVKKIMASASVFGDDCILPGFVKNIRKYYLAADIFVHPAIGEPFGRAVVEAQASGLPVVAFRSGSMEQVIEDGVTGFISDLKSTMLAEAMLKLASDESISVKMGSAASLRVRTLFDVERCAKEVLSYTSELYLEICPRVGRILQFRRKSLGGKEEYAGLFEKCPFSKKIVQMKKLMNTVLTVRILVMSN